MSPNSFDVESEPTVPQFWILAAISLWTILGFVLFFGGAEKKIQSTHCVVTILFHVICFIPRCVSIIVRDLIRSWNHSRATQYKVKHHFSRTFWNPLRLRMPSITVPPGRMAIITGGATVVFRELLDEVATPKFLRALSDAGFENILIQCGTYETVLHDRLAKIRHENLNIKLQGFISNMKEQMNLCRGQAGIRPGGVVFSHAGTGTIADCWEAKVANVIVANPNLMDNHQAVFAEDMARDHETIVLGRLGHLDEAVPKAVAVIKAHGLEDVPPSQEPVLPVSDDIRFGFIDNLFEV